jgi:hypothetical protein
MLYDYSAPKLKKRVNIKELIEQEVDERVAYVDSNVFIYPLISKGADPMVKKAGNPKKDS